VDRPSLARPNIGVYGSMWATLREVCSFSDAEQPFLIEARGGECSSGLPGSD
jgi:hypothetical protein